MNDVSASNPEIARTVEAGGISTNCHDVGAGTPVLMIHGSGPGVSAWVNWRLVMPSLAERFRVGDLQELEFLHVVAARRRNASRDDVSMCGAYRHSSGGPRAAYHVVLSLS